MKMKRFLGILVASMFLGSAAYAAESDRKVGIVGEQKEADEKAKSADVKGAPAHETKKRDSKVGFVGDEKKADEKAKSTGAKGAAAPETKKRDSKVGFEG